MKTDEKIVMVLAYIDNKIVDWKLFTSERKAKEFLKPFARPNSEKPGSTWKDKNHDSIYYAITYEKLN